MQWCAPTYSAQTAIVFFCNLQIWLALKLPTMSDPIFIRFQTTWGTTAAMPLSSPIFLERQVCVFTNEVEPLGNWVIGPGDPLQFRSLARAWLWQAYDSKVVVPYLPNKPRHLTHVWQCALSGGGLFSFTPECRDECEAEKRQDTYLCYLICATARRFCFFRFFVGSLW